MANTYTGLTYDFDGGLILGKSAGNAVAGNLRVGDGVGTAGSAFVQLGGSNQIADAATVTLYADGLLNLQSYSDTVGAVTLYGGSITGTGTLGLGGNLTFSGTSAATAAISAGLALNGSRTFTINDNGATDTDLAVSGVISDGSTASGLTKAGAGTLGLSGQNTFSGGLSVLAGRVLIGASSTGTITSGPLGTGAVNLGDTSGSTAATLVFDTPAGLTVANAITARTGSTGTLTLGGLNTSGVDTFTGAVTLGRTVSVTAEAGGEVDFNGVLSGAGGITKVNPGTVQLNAANTFTGLTTVSAGTLRYGVDNALGTGAVSVLGGTLDLGAGHVDNVGSVILDSGGAITGSGAATLTSTSGFDFRSGSVSTALGGAVALTKSTTGTVILSGTNTYTGATTVSAGTLQMGVNDGLSHGTDVSVASGATFALNNFSTQVGSLAGAGTVSLGTGTLTAGGSNATTTFSGVISGSGGVTKIGTGDMTLIGVNTYTGATTVNAGTLHLGVANAVNSASALNVAAGTFDLAGYGTTVASIAGAGNITLGGGTLTAGSSNASTVFSGVMSGAGSFVKQGTGTLSLTGTNTTTGSFDLFAGTLSLSGTNGALSAASNVNIRTGAEFDIDNTSGVNANRLGNSTGVTLNGGTLKFISGTSGSSETLGLLNLSGGASTVTVVNNGGTGTSINLTFSGIGTLANGATVNFGATGGTLGGDTTGPHIYITGQAEGVLGGWATVGGDAAEYYVNGVRAFSNYYEGSLGINVNDTTKLVRLSSTSASSATVLTNAGGTNDLGLNLTDASTVNLGSDPTRSLNLQNGSLIKSTSTATVISGAGGLTAGGTSAGNLGVSVTSGSLLTISAPITDNSSAVVGLSKADVGTLVLSGNNTFSGGVFVNGGVLQVSSESNLGAANNDVNFLGGTLEITTGFVASSGKTLTVNAGLTGTLNIDAAQTLTLATTTDTLTTGNTASTLFKTGSGSLVVQGANPSFDGTLQIQQGAVELRNAQSLGDSVNRGTITLAGGGLALRQDTSTAFLNNVTVSSDATITVDRLSGAGAAVVHTLGNVSLAAQTLTIAGANGASLVAGNVNLTGAGVLNPTTSDLTVGAVSGNFDLTKTGAGALMISGASSYTGATTINAGTLRLTASNVLPDATTAAVASGATLDLNGNSDTIAALSGAGSVTLGNGTLTLGTVNSTFGGVVSGTGGLTKTGSGTLTLSGVNTYTGATTVNAGTVSLAGVNDLSAGTDVTVASGATLQLNGNNTAVASIAGAGTIQLGAGTLTSGADTSTFSGTINGTGGLAKTGSGTLTLTGANNYTGASAVNAGTVVVTNALGLGSGGVVTVASGAELDLQNNIAVGAKALTLNGSGASGAGALVNASGANSWAGAVTLGSDTVIGSASGGSMSFGGNVALAAHGLTFSGAGDAAVVGGVSGATGSGLTMSGTGTLTLYGANTYNGVTTISTGVLSLQNNTALGATGTGNGTVVASGAALQIDQAGGGFTVGAEGLTLRGSGPAGLGALRNLNGDTTWGGAITLAADTTLGVDNDSLTLNGNLTESGGARALTKVGSGTLILAGTTSNTGATVISAGTLQLAAAERISDNSAVTVASGATLDLNDNSETVGSLTGAGTVLTGGNAASVFAVGRNNTSTTFSGSIQESGGLTKQGTGTLTLTGTSNTFTGPLTVSAGKLEAAANGSLSAVASVQVNSGGTLLLSGTGTDRVSNSAPITLAGGTLARGNGSVGAAGNEGTGASRSAVGVVSGMSAVGLGALTLQATSTLDFSTDTPGTLVFASFTPGTYTLNILNYTPTTNGALSDGSSDRLIFNQDQSANLTRFNFGSGFAAPVEIVLDNGFYEITALAVPEPATWLNGALLLALTGFCGRAWWSGSRRRTRA